jgi:hypothetical protein
MAVRWTQTYLRSADHYTIAFCFYMIDFGNVYLALKTESLIYKQSHGSVESEVHCDVATCIKTTSGSESTSDKHHIKPLFSPLLSDRCVVWLAACW